MQEGKGAVQKAKCAEFSIPAATMVKMVPLTHDGSHSTREEGEHRAKRARDHIGGTIGRKNGGTSGSAKGMKHTGTPSTLPTTKQRQSITPSKHMTLSPLPRKKKRRVVDLNSSDGECRCGLLHVLLQNSSTRAWGQFGGGRPP